MATVLFPTLNLSVYGHPLLLFRVEEEEGNRWESHNAEDSMVTC